MSSGQTANGTGPADSSFVEWTIGTGLAFTPGQTVIVTYTLDPTNIFTGSVYSYDPITGLINVNNIVIIAGDWSSIWNPSTDVNVTINLSGIAGAKGSTGETGPIGAMTGPTGSTGYTGEIGTQIYGNTGSPGSLAPSTARPGDFYIDFTTGIMYRLQ